jgi:hypothetical protein
MDGKTCDIWNASSLPSMTIKAIYVLTCIMMDYKYNLSF